MPAKPSFEPLSLSIEETMRTLTRSRGKVYEMIGDGTLIAFKDNGRTLVDYASVKAHYASLPKFVPGISIQNAPHMARKRLKAKR